VKRSIAALTVACTAFFAAHAAWYWPFGGGDKTPPRVSELTEKASELMDEAADLASDGKVEEAVQKYREARAELDRVEVENPSRAATAEFATVRNKKAYIEATVDSLLLKQAELNAKAVAVTDTTALERRYKIAKALEKKPGDRKLLLQSAAGDIEDRHFGDARAKLSSLLQKNANDAAALNLLAAVETSEGRVGEAESILMRAMEAAPDSHFARYNLARLLLDHPRFRTPEQAAVQARKYYNEGRAKCGGPADPALEKAIDAAFKAVEEARKL